MPRGVYGRNGKLAPTDAVNVLVLLHSANATTYAAGLLDALSAYQTQYPCKKMPVIMSYSIQDRPAGSRLVLERIPLPGNGVFTRLDSTRPGEDLFWCFCEKKSPIEVPPDQFSIVKAQYGVMNDDPPPLFCATFLWPRIIHYAISERSYDPVSKSMYTYTKVDISVDDLRQWVMDYWSPDPARKSFRKEWVTSGLEFLAQAGLATSISAGEECVTVHLQRAVGGRSHHDLEGQADLNATAEVLADRCAKRAAEELSRPAKRAKGADQPALPFG